MNNKLINPGKYYCGLDIGSHKLKAALIKHEGNGALKLDGIQEIPVQGLKNDSVSHLSDLAECFGNCINKLTRAKKVRLKELHVGIGGGVIESKESQAVIPLIEKGGRVISRRDVQKVRHQAKLLGASMEEEILHHLPQFFSVDDINSALNPLGLYGRKLGIQSLLITAQSNRIRNIAQAIHQAGYDVEELSFNSFRSSKVVLNEEKLIQGCCLIDIGSHCTSILIFREGIIQFIENLHVGGDVITNSISRHLDLSFDLAEEIKKSYAVALETDLQHEEEILVKKDNMYIPIKKEAIYRAVAPEIERFVESVRGVLKTSGFYDQINRGIVFIGGGCLLPGLIERIGEATNLSAELGKIQLSQLEHNLTAVSSIANAIGLAYYGYQKDTEKAWKKNGKSGWAQYVTHRLKEIYQEYF